MTDLTTRAASEWGAEAHMNPLESLMWRAELNPRLRSTGVLLEVLDGPPERERLIAAHEWATDAYRTESDTQRRDAFAHRLARLKRKMAVHTKGGPQTAFEWEFSLGLDE